jgi:hypothetical protein
MFYIIKISKIKKKKETSLDQDPIFIGLSWVVIGWKSMNTNGKWKEPKTIVD